MVVSILTRNFLCEKIIAMMKKSKSNIYWALAFYCVLQPSLVMSSEYISEVRLCSDTKSIGMSEALLLAPIMLKQRWSQQHNDAFASRVESLDIVVISADSDFSKVRCLGLLPEPSKKYIYDTLKTMRSITVPIFGKIDRVFDGQNGLEYTGYTINNNKMVVVVMH
jgi:hypothetical protein